MNFEDNVQEYYEKNSQKLLLEKQIKPLNEAIKKEMNDDLKKDIGNYEIKIITQDRSKVNESKLIALLKELDLNHAIKMVETIDEAMIERLIYSGDISQEDYAKCIDQKYVKTLKIIKK